MRTRTFMLVMLLAVVTFGLVYDGASQSKGKKATASKSVVERGKYLVNFGGCNDCHTPKLMTAKGPAPDTTRLLSGQPANDKVPVIPSGALGPNGWAAMTNSHQTAWAGPWGVSFARNLTPDKTTGLGTWTAAIFIKAMRTGKDMGEGRQILPPMPWFDLAGLKDEDLRAIFAYLQSIPAVQNAVPDPIPPETPQVK